MHSYAVFGHDRVKIGRWLGVASILIAGGVSSFVEWSSEHIGFLAFVEGSIGTGAVYFLLHYLFNHFAWKIPFFKIPDLTGNWNFTGKTLNDDGTVKYEWEGVAGIKQTWKDISIH